MNPHLQLVLPLVLKLLCLSTEDLEILLMKTEAKEMLSTTASSVSSKLLIPGFLFFS